MRILIIGGGAPLLNERRPHEEFLYAAAQFARGQLYIVGANPIDCDVFIVVPDQIAVGEVEGAGYLWGNPLIAERIQAGGFLFSFASQDPERLRWLPFSLVPRPYPGERFLIEQNHGLLSRIFEELKEGLHYRAQFEPIDDYNWTPIVKALNDFAIAGFFQAGKGGVLILPEFRDTQAAIRSLLDQLIRAAPDSSDGIAHVLRDPAGPMLPLAGVVVPAQSDTDLDSGAESTQRWHATIARAAKPRPGLSARVFRILVSSPTDMLPARMAIAEVISQWNWLHSDEREIVLLPGLWEQGTAPAFGQPQDVINEQLVGKCDAVIALFGSRLGTPTRNAPSGTAEEIELLVSQGRRAMVYFQTHDSHGIEFSGREFDEVVAYKRWLRDRALYWEFKSVDQLKHLVSAHLFDLVRDFAGQDSFVSGGPADGFPSKPPAPEVVQPASEAKPQVHVDDIQVVPSETQPGSRPLLVVRITNVGSLPAISLLWHLNHPDIAFVRAGLADRDPRPEWRNARFSGAGQAISLLAPGESIRVGVLANEWRKASGFAPEAPLTFEYGGPGDKLWESRVRVRFGGELKPPNNEGLIVRAEQESQAAPRALTKRRIHEDRIMPDPELFQE